LRSGEEYDLCGYRSLTSRRNARNTSTDRTKCRRLFEKKCRLSLLTPITARTCRQAAFFSENAVRITPAGIFRGREAIGRELQRVSVDLSLHDYSVKRTVSRLQGNMVFNAGEWQARLRDGKQYHGYY